MTHAKTSTPVRVRWNGWTWARLAVLGVLLTSVLVVEARWGWPDVAVLRERVDSAGSLGVLVYVTGYAALSLVPAPKALMTALGGLLFGLWLGALLSWAAAMLGAVVAFGLARILGRDAVGALARGRLEQADALLTRHGLGAVVAVRLVPVLPFTAINYAAGLTGVRFAHYVMGSAAGMVPGSLAYAALGAWGTDPWGLFAALAALVVLVLVGGVLGRRLLGSGVNPGSPAERSPVEQERD